jgi:hypothetical protein
MTEAEVGAHAAELASPSVLEDEPARRWGALTSPRLALLSGLLYLPFTVLGYGTDVDITNVLRSGESLLDGDYRYSRPPGALPYEGLVGVLDRLGGPTAVNLASAAMAVALLVLLARLVSEELGERRARIAVVVVATQPWFWLAATSSVTTSSPSACCSPGCSPPATTDGCSPAWPSPRRSPSAPPPRSWSGPTCWPR